MAGPFLPFEPEQEHDDLPEDLVALHRQLLAEGALARTQRPTDAPLLHTIDVLLNNSSPPIVPGVIMNDTLLTPAPSRAATRARWMGIGSVAAVILVVLLALFVFQPFHGNVGGKQPQLTATQSALTAGPLGAVTVKGTTFTIDQIFANATHTELSVLTDDGLSPECGPPATCPANNFSITDKQGNQVGCTSYTSAANSRDAVAECAPLPPQDLGHSVALTIRVYAMGDASKADSKHITVGPWQVTVTTTTTAPAYSAVPAIAPMTYQGITIQPIIVMAAIDDGRSHEFADGGIYLQLHIDGTHSPYAACLGMFNFVSANGGGSATGPQGIDAAVTLPGAQPVGPSVATRIALTPNVLPQNCPTQGAGVNNEDLTYFMPLKMVPTQITLTIQQIVLVSAASQDYFIPGPWRFTIPLN